MSKKLFLSLLALVMWGGAPAMARNADLLLSPTRIVLENGSKYATVTLRNNGDGVGRYKIELVDATMDERGGIKLLPEGTQDAFSAQDLISLSPRNMTLKPDESLPLRILVKNMADKPDGEYKSHLQVRMTENDLDLATGRPATDGASVVIKPKMVTVIPVIIRKGQTEYKVSLDEAKLTMGAGEGKQKPEVQATLSMTGNRSILGDFKVVHVAPDGKETQLAFFRGVAIYRGVAKRTQSVPLDVPEGINVHSGRLQVAFMSQENEGGKVLTSKDVTP